MENEYQKHPVSLDCNNHKCIDCKISHTTLEEYPCDYCQAFHPYMDDCYFQPKEDSND